MVYAVHVTCHIYLDIHLDIHLNVHLNVNLDIHLNIHLNVHLNVYLNVHLILPPPHLAANRFSTSASHPRSSVRQRNQSPFAGLALLIYRELALVETVESYRECADFLDIAVEIRGGDDPRAFQTEFHVSNDQFRPAVHGTACSLLYLDADLACLREYGGFTYLVLAFHVSFHRLLRRDGPFIFTEIRQRHLIWRRQVYNPAISESCIRALGPVRNLYSLDNQLVSPDLFAQNHIDRQIGCVYSGGNLPLDLKRGDLRRNLRQLHVILDAAGNKGTGKWTSQSALDLGVPLSLITESVFARYISAYKEERVHASKVLPKPAAFKFEGDKAELIEKIRQALYFSKIISYAQGFAQLRVASKENNWNLPFADIASIWRDGCIIRSRFLQKITDAYNRDADLANLLLDEYFLDVTAKYQQSVRDIVALAVQAGVPVPTFSAAITYFDSYRSADLPANLIQAQRDYFGAHTYQRKDKEGTFHYSWYDEK